MSEARSRREYPCEICQETGVHADRLGPLVCVGCGALFDGEYRGPTPDRLARHILNGEDKAPSIRLPFRPADPGDLEGEQVPLALAASSRSYRTFSVAGRRLLWSGPPLNSRETGEPFPGLMLVVHRKDKPPRWIELDEILRTPAYCTNPEGCLVEVTVEDEAARRIQRRFWAQAGAAFFLDVRSQAAIDVEVFQLHPDCTAQLTWTSDTQE